MIELGTSKWISTQKKNENECSFIRDFGDSLYKINYQYMLKTRNSADIPTKVDPILGCTSASGLLTHVNIYLS